MMHKAWCIEAVPYCFSRSSIKFQGPTGWKIDDLNPIWGRLLGLSQLSNPSDLPCFILIHKLSSGILWHSPENNFIGIAQGINLNNEFENDTFRTIFVSPRHQWVHNQLTVATYENHTKSISNFYASMISINLSPPGAAYMRKWIGWALVQIMACRLYGTKPLSKPMLGYCQLNPKEQTSVKS